jgi:hypothetical protein
MQYEVHCKTVHAPAPPSIPFDLACVHSFVFSTFAGNPPQRTLAGSSNFQSDITMGMNTPKSRLFLIALAFLGWAQLAFIATVAAQDVTYFWSGRLTPESILINAKFSADCSVRAVVSTDPNFSTTIYSASQNAVNASNNRILSFPVSGLATNTQYYYRFEVNGNIITSNAAQGQFKTPVDGPMSFNFILASCAFNSDHAAYDKMAEHETLFYLNGGDLHYANISTTSVVDHLEAYEDEVLSKDRSADFLKSRPIAYVWDDHDFCGDNSFGAVAGREAARLAYQQYVPHYPLGAGSGDVPIYQAFTIGRVRFIITDLRSERVSGVTKMGLMQKNWFKSEVLAARDNGQIIAWVSPTSYSGNITDNWGGYTDERTELANFFRDNDIENMFILSGDAHMVAIDNGDNADFASGVPNTHRYPIFQAAAINNFGSNKGGTYSEGVWTNPFITTGQYGLVTVTDDLDSTVCVEFKAYRVEGVFGSQSTLVTYNFCRTLSSNMVTSVSDPSKAELKIFPNPTNGRMTLEFQNSGAATAVEIVLTDLNGAVLRRTDAKVVNGHNKLSYDAADIAVGYYVLTLNTDKGSFSETVRIEH